MRVNTVGKNFVRSAEQTWLIRSQRKDSVTDRVHIMADHIERAGRAGYRRVSLAIQRRSGSTVIHDRDLNNFIAYDVC